MSRVLVIDDDPSLRRALTVALGHDGYDVRVASDGESGLSEVALYSPDVVVLDLGLPDVDGITVCRRIRAWSDVPIIVLSATVSELRKVAALDEGANDYVTKPFGMAELVARIRAALRHRSVDVGDATTELRFDRVHLDLVHVEATCDGVALKLTSREFDLLAFLVRHAGKVCTHQTILRAVWGETYASETQYLHAYVHRLRLKLRHTCGDGVTITTVPGIGYSLSTSDGENADTA